MTKTLEQHEEELRDMLEIRSENNKITKEHTAWHLVINNRIQSKRYMIKRIKEKKM